MFTKNLFKLSLTLVVLVMTLAAVTLAQTTFYVNNQTGLDGYNGLSATVGSTGVGPKLTIANAVLAAVNGDIISVAFTGVTYGDINTIGKTLTFTSTGGTPVVANMLIDAATTLSGPVSLAGTGTLTLTAAVTNANNITIADGGTISRGTSGSLDVAPAFAGKAKVAYTATATIGPEMPTATSVLVNLNVTGAITVTVNRAIQMSGILTVDNAAGVLALGGNTLSMVTTTGSTTHSVVGNVTATAAGGIIVTTTTGTQTLGGAGGGLPGLTTSATTGSVVVNGPLTITGSVVDNGGTLTLTTPTGASGLTGSLTNNGTGTVTVSAALTIGGNVSNTSTGVITFAAVNITVTGNVSNTGTLSNTTTTQIANKANINFGDAVIAIGGNVTNSATFAGTSGDVTLGGFSNCGNITFASTASAVTITGLLTNSAASTFTTTAAVTAATLLSGSGRVTFANTSGNATFTGGITNSSSGFTDLGTTPIAAVPENGSVIFAGRTTGTLTVGTGANVTNNSSNTGTGKNGVIDFTAAATGAETLGGNVSLDNSAGTGGIIFGTGASSVTGTVSNARSVAAAAITFWQTANTVSVGALSQSGKGTILFNATTGNITVATGGSLAVSNGEIKALTTTGAITINGNFTQTGGKFTASALTVSAVTGLTITGNFSLSSGTCNISATGNVPVAITGDFSFTGGTLTLGAGTRNFTVTGANLAISAGTAYSGGANTTLIVNRATSAQTLTSGVGVIWPGNLNINNTFPAAPTFNLNGGNLIVNGNVTFSTGGAANGVNLNNNTLFVKGTGGVANFTNNSGYTGGANGFVSMQGAAAPAQIVNGSANFFNIEVDNANNAVFGTGTAATYTITGTFNLTNGVVSTGAGDIIALNNATTPPTIVRNAGSFAGTPTMTSTINVVYIGANKTMTNEIPVGGSNKLVNLTIATTGAGVITVAAPFEFSGTLTINAGQTLALATFVVTSNGSAVVSNGSWTSTTGKLVLNKAAGTAVTAAGALPQIDVAAASLGNTITGTGITVGTTPSLSLVGATGSVTMTFTGAGPHIAKDLATTSGSTDAVTLGSNVIVGGVLTHNGGSIALGANTLTIKGSGSQMDGAATITGTGTLVFNATGSSNLTITTSAATIAANVQLNLDALASNLTLLGNNLTIAGNLTLTKGTFDLSNPKNLTLTGNALNLTADGATAGTGVLKFAPATGTLTATLAGATAFNNLTIDGNVTLAGTTGDLTIATTLTHASGLLTFADRNIITSTFTRTGGTYSATTGALEVQTALTQGTGFSIPNLTISGSFTVGSAQDFTVTNTLHLKSGTFTHTSTTPRLNIPINGTVQVTAGALDVVPVYAGAFNLTYTPAAAATPATGLEWPAAGVVNTLTINGGAGSSVKLATGSRAVTTALVLTAGDLDLVSSARTLTLSDGAAISRTGSATLTLNSGVLAFAGVVDVTYNGTVAIAAVGPELPTSATALRNLTFTRTGNVVNFLATNASNITVNGTLSIRNNLTSTGTITALGDVAVSTDNTGSNATAPTITFGAALTFKGTTDQTITVPGATSVSSITVNKPTGNLLIAGGDLTCTGTVTFISGLVITGSNSLILTNSAGATTNKGYVRTVAAGSKSHVVGNVKQNLQFSTLIAYARNEFPVGDLANYRPVALTFLSSSAGNFGIFATVSHTNTRPTGISGLPIADAIVTGTPINGYPSFFWTIKTDGPMGATAFNLDLTGEGALATEVNLADVGANRVKIIRRSGTALDVQNIWNLQGISSSYDNQVIAGVPTVTAVNANGGLSTAGAIFTYGYAGASTGSKVSGTLTYANPTASGIGNATVTLTPAAGAALTTTSSTTGAYAFTNVPAGTYTVAASKIGTWGGVTGGDALLVARHAAGIALLTGLPLTVADVNNSSSVAGSDALLIVRRALGLDASFVAGDWKFSSQSVAVGQSDTVINLNGLCVGDVNASYVPAVGTVFAKTASVSLANGSTIFGVSSSSAMTLGSATIRIDAKSVKIAEVTSKLPGFVSRITESGLVFAWFAADGKTAVKVNANEPLISVKLEGKATEGSSVTVETELTDINGTVMNNEVAMAVKEIPSVFALAQNYPNPFNPSTTINYNLPQAGMVTLTIYNVMGQEVAKLVNEQMNAGTYSVEWAPRNMASGMYIYRINVQTEKEVFTSSKRLMLLK